jgi:hypothetical protein
VSTWNGQRHIITTVETSVSQHLSIAPDPGTGPLGRDTADSRARPLLWLLLVLCAAYLPIFFGQIIFFRDSSNWTAPARWFVRHALLAGDFPSWNPQQGLGFPVFASPLYGLFYPPNWLYLVVPESWVAAMVTWQCFLHVVWGSLGIWLLARALGASRLGACVAGVAWGLSGFTAAEWTAGVRLLAGAWVPWMALGGIALVRRVRAGGWAWVTGSCLAALPIGMSLLAGEFFVAIFGVGFGLCTALVYACRNHPIEGPAATRGSWPRWVLAAALALALGAGVGSITVLPAWSAAPAGQRSAAFTRALAEIGSFHPYRVVELVAPGCMGRDPYQSYPAAPWIGDPDLDGWPLTLNVYLGASVIALALMGFGRGRRLSLWLGVLAAMALATALGRHMPVHRVLRTLIPPLGYMRFPEKYLVLVVAWVALLAGLGATRLLTEQRQPWRRVAGLVIVLLALAGLAPSILPSLRWAEALRQAGLTGAAVVAVVLGVQFLVGRRPRLAACILVVSVGVDLATAIGPLQAFVPRTVATEVPWAARSILADHKDPVTPPRLFRDYRVEAATRRFVPVSTRAGYQRREMETSITNTNVLFGIAGLPGYDAAIFTREGQLWQAGQHDAQSLLRLVGVNYVILGVENPNVPAAPVAGLVPLLDPLPGARLFRVEDPLPRVFLAGRSEIVSDAQVLRRVFDREIVSGETALLAPEAGAQELPGPAGRPGACHIDRFGNSEIVARCQGERSALAVFVEESAPGWHAEVDGQPAPLWRCNLLMRAVPVAAGAHTIALRYSAPGFTAAAVVSSTALLLIMVLGFLAALLVRREPVTAPNPRPTVVPAASDRETRPEAH